MYTKAKKSVRYEVIALSTKQSKLGKGQVAMPVLVSHTIGIAYDCQNCWPE